MNIVSSQRTASLTDKLWYDWVERERVGARATSLGSIWDTTQNEVAWFCTTL